jgi:hypothetical protein
VPFIVLVTVFQHNEVSQMAYAKRPTSLSKDRVACFFSDFDAIVIKKSQTEWSVRVSGPGRFQAQRLARPFERSFPGHTVNVLV